MALDPNMLNSLPDTLVDMYGAVEIDILSDMARRISAYDYFIPAALHQNQKLQELGMVQSEIIAKLSALTGRTQEEIVSLLSEATSEAVADDVEYYTRAEVYEPSKVDAEALYSQLNSGLLQTEQAFFNITQTTANSGAIQFIEALDRAWTQINVGGMDYNTAIRDAIKDLGTKGLNAVNTKGKIVNGAIRYNKTGHVDTLEVAVRRAVMTGTNQTAAKTQEVLADELGVDLVEVTAHGGARPEHAKWQGKVYSRKGEITIDGVTYEDFETATRYGHGDGLCGWNCRHNFHPYVHGTSRTYSEKDLKALEEKKVEYNGEKYTEYEASQIQRRIEREIRAMKRTVAALEAVGEDASGERKGLREAQKKYTDFTAQTGIRKQSNRTQIATGTGTERRPAPITPTQTELKPKKQTFIPVKTKQEAEEYAKKQGVNADYSGYDISVANEINKTMNVAKEIFGEHALERLKEIRTYKKGEQTQAWGGYSEKDGRLALRGVKGKDAIEKMGEKLRTKYIDGMFSTDSDLHLIRHEVGHAIHDTLGTWADKEIQEFIKDKNIREEISFYAGQDVYELVAESVAQYFNGTANDTVKEIIKIMQNNFTKKFR